MDIVGWWYFPRGHGNIAMGTVSIFVMSRLLYGRLHPHDHWLRISGARAVQTLIEPNMGGRAGD